MLITHDLGILTFHFSGWLHHRVTWNSARLLLLFTISFINLTLTPESFPWIGCVNSSSLLFNLRTAFPTELKWTIRREFQSPNLPSLAFQAISGSTLVSARTRDTCTTHSSAAICCFRKDDFFLFPVFLSTSFLIVSLLTSLLIPSAWMTLAISIFLHYSWPPLQLLLPPTLFYFCPLIHS